MLKCKLNTSQASLTSWAFSLHWCEEKTTYIWGLEKLVHHSQDVAGGGGGGRGPGGAHVVRGGGRSSGAAEHLGGGGGELLGAFTSRSQECDSVSEKF